jgi:hypothetical protein
MQQALQRFRFVNLITYLTYLFNLNEKLSVQDNTVPNAWWNRQMRVFNDAVNLLGVYNESKLALSYL